MCLNSMWLRVEGVLRGTEGGVGSRKRKANAARFRVEGLTEDLWGFRV